MIPVLATMRGFPSKGPTSLALGGAVPCRPGGTTAEAYKHSKGINDVSCTVLALLKAIFKENNLISDITSRTNWIKGFLEMYSSVLVEDCGPAIPTADRKNRHSYYRV